MSLASHPKNPAHPVHRFMQENLPDARAVVRAANAGLEGAAPDHREGADQERGHAERLEEMRGLRERRSRSRWRRIICR